MWKIFQEQKAHRFDTGVCSEHEIKLNYNKLDENVGPPEAFRLAISKSSGDIIFLSDHDDVWNLDRIEKVIPYHMEATLVLSNGLIHEDNKKDKRLYEKLEFNLFKIIRKNKFIGATFSIDGNFARHLSKLIFILSHARLDNLLVFHALEKENPVD